MSRDLLFSDQSLPCEIFEREKSDSARNPGVEDPREETELGAALDLGVKCMNLGVTQCAAEEGNLILVRRKVCPTKGLIESR
jgi:hypothetical protein